MSDGAKDQEECVISHVKQENLTSHYCMHIAGFNKDLIVIIEKKKTILKSLSLVRKSGRIFWLWAQHA